MNVNTIYAAGSPMQDILLERARFGGFPEERVVPQAADLQVTRLGKVHSNVFFSSTIFMAYALNIRSFDMAVNTRAVQVFTDKRKVIA